jgi:hypothetical protein
MIPKNTKYVPLGVDIDFNTAASNLSDSINMKNYHDALFLIQLADIGTASPVLLVYSGATNAACTSALAFKYRFGGAAAGSANCDVFGDWTDCAETGLVLTHGTYDNYLLQVYVDGADMDVANAEEWLTLDFTDPGNATGQAIVIAALTPRYSSGTEITALV